MLWNMWNTICKTGEAFWAFQSIPECPKHSETLGTPAQFYRCSTSHITAMPSPSCGIAPLHDDVSKSWPVYYP